MLGTERDEPGFGVNMVPSRYFWVGSGLEHHKCAHSQKVGYALGCCLCRHMILFLLGAAVSSLTLRNMQKVVRWRESRPQHTYFVPFHLDHKSR